MIAGTVTDEFDDPAPAVEVVLLQGEYAAGALRWSRRTASRTDDEGAYRIERVRPGVGYVLLVRPTDLRRLPAMSDAPSDPRLRRPVSVPTYFPGVAEREGATLLRLRGGEHRQGVDVRLRRAPSFCVEAAAGAGRAVQLFTVQETNQQLGIVTGGVTGLPRSGTPGPDGGFRVCDLAPGEYAVAAAEGDLNDPKAMATAIVAIRDGDVARLVLPPVTAVRLPIEFAWAGNPPERPVEAKLRLALNSLTRSFGGFPVTEAAGVPGTTEFKEIIVDDYVHRVIGLNGRLYVESITYGNDAITFGPLRPGSALTGAPVRVLLGHDGALIKARVRNRVGAAVAHATVVVMPEAFASEAEFAAAIHHGQADQAGNFAASRAVAPGKLYVIAMATPLGEPIGPDDIARLRAMRSRAREVTAAPNADLDLELETIE